MAFNKLDKKLGMLETDVPPSAQSRFALRSGMLLGLAAFVINVSGLVWLHSLKSRLGAMPRGIPQGWITYAFMDDYGVVLSLAWVSLCVVVPSLYLAKQRKWRCFVGMLMVMGPALFILLGLVLWAAGLKSGLRGVTG